MATKKATKTKSQAKKTKSTAKVVSAKPTTKRSAADQLRRWNILLAGFLGLQAIAIFILSKNVHLPVVTRYLTGDSLASEVAGQSVLAPAARHLFDINIASLVTAFLLVAAAAYAALATVHRKRYDLDLSQRINRTRWINYGIGASLMMIVIGLINGIQDIASLAMIVALVVILHGLAFKNELYNKDAPISWRQFWGILLAGGAVWLVIALYVKGAVVYGTGLPHYIYWLDITTFIILLAMAANIWLTTAKRGRWADYIFAERAYMLLSLLLSTSIAWQIFFGSLQ